jgi:hypothetical protein
VRAASARVGASRAAPLTRFSSPSSGSPSHRHRAARFLIAIERLALSPQAGLATLIVGNDLAVCQEKAKPHVIAEIARRV